METPTEDSVRLTATLKKLKTQKKKYFVLHAGGNSVGPRLEYHDTEKKYKPSGKPKRSILLQSCMNIDKRSDSKHKYTVVLFTKDDSFGLVFDAESEQNEWHKTMLSLRAQIGITKPRFDCMWEVHVEEKGLTNMKYLSEGCYRMYLTNKNLGFIRLTQDESDFELPLATVKSCGHNEKFFNLVIGSAAVTGAASIWMKVDDHVLAQSMHETVLQTMKYSSQELDMKPPVVIRPRLSSSAKKDGKSSRSTLRRTSTSVGESSTLPRKLSTRHTDSQGTPSARRSTVSMGTHKRDSAMTSLSDLMPRARTDSVSSHGSHRTDHSAHSSDVEVDPFHSDFQKNASAARAAKRGMQRERSKKSLYGTPEERPMKHKG